MKKLYHLNTILVVFYFFIIGLPAFSQNINQPTFHNLDADDFGVKRVSHLLYSKTLGKIWLGNNKGLGIYNGYKTKLYPHFDSISNTPLSNNISSLYEDKAGKLWIGYADVAGLTSFDPKTELFTHFKYDSLVKGSFPNTVPSRYLEDSDERFWVSTWGGGLLLFNKERTNFKIFKPEDKPNSSNWIKSNTIRDMVELEPNKILISYFHEQPYGYPGIFDVEKNTVTPFPIDEYKGSLSKTAIDAIKRMLCIVHFIYHDKKYEKLWIGTYSGLVYIDLKNKICKRVSAKTFDENIWQNLDNTTEYIVDESDRLWTSTNSSGILVVNLKTTKAFYSNNYHNCNNCIADNLIGGFTRDNDGNIWVTSGAKGVSIYTPFKHQFKLKLWESLKVEFSNFSHQHIPLNKYYLGKNQSIYLTSSKGISHYNFEIDSLYQTYDFIKTALDQNNVRFVGNSLYFRSYDMNKGMAKLSVLNNLNKSLKQSKAYYNLDPFLFRNDTIKHTTYYISANRKAICAVDSNFKHDTLFRFKTGTHIEAKYSTVLKNGKWFLSGTNDNFYVFDPTKKNLLRYDHHGTYDRLFNDSSMLGYFYNNAGKVWITTRNGIHSYDEQSGEIKSWNKEIGLDKSVAVFGLVEVENGDIWFTTFRDFYKYDFRKKRLTCFNKTIGISTYGFDHRNEIHTMITNGKYVFFPAQRGLLYFDASKIKLPDTKVKLTIYNIIINDSVLQKIELNSFIEGKKDLAYNQNNIQIELHTNQMYVPSQNKFSYCLLGLSDKWVDNERSNKIILQNLPSGTYTLNIKCKNSYDIESDDYSIVFTINKPFWKTWWFMLLVLIALVLVVIYTIRLREKTLQKRQAELEKTVEERTQEVVNKANEINKQKELIEEKQKEIFDSINYAERIQKSFMATKESLDSNLPDYFIFFKPKDIVSGDFYWSATLSNGNFAIVTADSTGHGVPGAIMSLLNITSLEKAIEHQVLPNEILNDTRKTIIERLKNDGSIDGGKDGMDCSICVYDLKKMKLYIAAANNPVWIIRDKEVIEIKADKMPVGKHDKQNTSFNLHQIDLQKNDLIITLTDGFGDQFGGEKGKKFKNKKLRELIIENAHLPLVEQKENLARTFNEWKNNLEQIDDVCVIGVKI
ncbi:MAG: SpoIIE family protein phosphatase [Bacteroidota bacterium]|nr:SpoIIE family protein phosphatase [Bacteroidota bacterium]